MSLEEEMHAALGTFVVEGRELLLQMEAGLLGLEEDADPAEAVNALFRAAHTIKGSSGLFGLDHLVRFTHVLESVLDRLRTDEITVSAELVGALLPCVDHLAVLMLDVADGRLEEDPGSAEQGAQLLAGLRPFLDGDGGSVPVEGGDEAEPEHGGLRDVHVSVRFGADCLRAGMDPLAFIRYLSTLGEVTGVVTLTDLLPDAASLDPECSHLDFEITLNTDADLESVQGVFEFVRAESLIGVFDAGSPAADVQAHLAAAGPLGPRIRDIMIESGIVDPAASDAGPDGDHRPGRHVAASGEAGAGGPAATWPGSASDSASGPAVARIPAQNRAADKLKFDTRQAPRESRSIRIDASRLDRLIDAVGELVIAGASAELNAGVQRDEALVIALNEVMRLVEEVRDSALQLRMVPIGTTFSRFQRVVRDVSADLGKDVALVISGGDTEVDKALVEQIGDPLMHLVRNSMDHGIEPADVRAELGKPARGTLRLNAFHDSGSIVIEVADDGGGIDPDRVLAKAIERGLVEPGESLSEQEVYGLIFEPGFSTAATVSDLSGRGVGMDVVKRNVTALRGTIDVDNRLDEGCTMRIRLPLTLAIIDGFMVGVGGASFVIPLDWVVECVELPAGADTRDCMGLRGEVLPFIRLRSLFAVAGERPRRENVVVVEYAGMKIGLVVDTLMGEFQTVIKPLGRLFEHVRGIGGSTILGNGEVALIIDVPTLIRHHSDRHEPAALVRTGSDQS
jgi:two-component system chemotaxis sensor kinase CheA